MKRIKSRSFYISALGVMISVLFGAFADALRIYQMSVPNVDILAHQGIIMHALSGDALLFAAPIFATIPYSNAFVEDVGSGYLKQVLPRTTVTHLRKRAYLCNFGHFYYYFRNTVGGYRYNAICYSSRNLSWDSGRISIS